MQYCRSASIVQRMQSTFMKYWQMAAAQMIRAASSCGWVTKRRYMLMRCRANATTSVI